MKVTVKLFAAIREAAGCETVTLELPFGSTAGDVRRALAQTYPAMIPLLARSALAIDNDFADDRTVISDASELAVIPPVSGG